MSNNLIRIQHVARLTNGFPFSSDDFSESGGMPLVRVRDIQPVEPSIFVDPEMVPTDVVIQDGDVVIGMDGDFNSVLWDRGPSAMNQRVCFLRIREGNDHRFLAYVLPEKLRAINELTYSTTVKHLSSWAVEHALIPWLPLNQQIAVANFLDCQTAKIDGLIDKQTFFIARLRERREAVIRAAFGPSSDVTYVRMIPVLGEIPAHWGVRPLWSLYRREKRTGYIDEPMVSVFREYGVVYKDEYENLNVTAEDRSIYQLVDPGWLVINRMKAWQGSVGISFIRGISSGHYLCFRPLEDLDHRYMNWLFRSPQYRDWFAANSRGVRPGQAEIDNDRLKAAPVLIPPPQDQRAIVERLERETAKIDTLIAKSQRMIELSRERRAALITATVTGQIDVTQRSAGERAVEQVEEAADEPAGVGVA